MSRLEERFPGCALVEKLAERQLEVYRRQPKELIANFNREWSAADSYRGRQLLELLQNTDDAGRDVSSGVRVLIQLLDDHLIVGNTGKPFEADGIESLVVSDVSPKQLERRFIGEKGLGFRSVLTWSASPLVASGDFVVAFDPERAREVANALASTHRAVGETLSRWRAREEDAAHPVATLRFPYVPNPTDERLSLALDVLGEGYDTVLVLPLRSGKAGQEVREQIERQLGRVSAETLLFCRHISELTIDSRAQRSWSILREERGDHTDVVVQEAGEDEPLLWRLYRKRGELPSDLRDDESGVREAPSYSLGVAAPDSLDMVTAADHCLSVFFPTEDRLPCPLVAHASLSTDDSRKRLTDHEANRFVLAELADLVARVAEREAQRVERLRGLELLSGIEDADPELSKLGFVNAVLDRVRTRRIFPRKSGEVTTGSDVVRPPRDVWLDTASPEVFPEVLDIPPDAPFRSFVDEIDLDWYDDAELARRCSEQVEWLDPQAAGRFIGRLIADRALPGDPLPEVLVGADGGLLPSSHTAFLPGGSLDRNLPAWVRRFGFLHDAFTEGLRDGLDLTSARELRRRLTRNGYSVEEYRLEGVARHLTREYRDEAERSPRERLQLARDVLGFLFGAANWDQGGHAHLKDVDVDIVTEEGSLRPAAKCYLGSSYPMGRLVHSLYSELGEDEFAGGPEALGLPEKPDEVGRFLIWLGAADAPRYRKLIQVPTSWKRDFGIHLLQRLAYPQHLAERTFKSAKEAIRYLKWTFSDIEVPERFEEVLDKSPPEAIVAFLSDRGRTHLRASSDGQLWVKQGRQTTFRPAPTVEVPDPTHYLLRKRAWIPGEDGEQHPPERVMLQETGLMLFDQIFHRPGIDPQHDLLASSGGQSTVRSVLTSLGAVLSVGSLEGDQLYRLLRDLPDHAPDGEQARRVYRQLAEASGLDTSSPLREKFVKEGKMWGRLGADERYFPVRRLRYADSGTIPTPVRERVPLAALPSRSGPEKMKEIFGVAALRDGDYAIQVDLDRTVTRKWSERARAELERAIPFLYASRLAHTADDNGRQRSALQRAKLHVCRQVTAEISVLETGPEKVTLEEDLQGLIADEEMYLICARPSWSEEELFASELGRDAMAGLLADVVGVASAQADFARIMACSSNSEKLMLLDRMTTGQGEQLLTEARERLEIEDEPSKIEFSPPADIGESADREAGPVDDSSTDEEVAETSSPDTDGTKREANGGTEGDERDGDSSDGEETDDEPEEGLVATIEKLLAESPFEKSSSPTPPSGGVRDRVVRSGGSGGGGGASSTSVIPENVTLDIAARFEENCGRHPLRVNHLQGLEGFGCDIISFRTAEALEEVVVVERVNSEGVERFIEVKGTTSLTGKVELTKNERNRAEELGDRYYLYRVYIGGEKQPEVRIAILQGPAGSDAEIVSRSFSYDLSEDSRTEWYSVGGPASA